MPINIISLAMAMFRNRESIAKIVAVLPELQKLFAELNPQEQPQEQQPHTDYAVGSMEWLQESLNTLADAELEVDGEYGPATNKAVSEFQKENGLKVDGWAGPETINLIVKQLAA
jgi:peptidoglycan hydrolase-like protein with peptidoglycan-binding domain